MFHIEVRYALECSTATPIFAFLIIFIQRHNKVKENESNLQKQFLLFTIFIMRKRDFNLKGRFKFNYKLLGSFQLLVFVSYFCCYFVGISNFVG